MTTMQIMTMAKHPTSAVWQDYQESLSPTARTAISSPRYSTSSDRSWEDDYVHAEQASAVKTLTTTTPSRSSRGSSSAKSVSIRTPSSSYLPAYTNANPFLYRVSAHSFTHSWPTHKLVSCRRCGSHDTHYHEEEDDQLDDRDQSSLVSVEIPAEREITIRAASVSPSFSSSLLSRNLTKSHVPSPLPSSSSPTSGSWSSLLGH